MKIVFFGDSVTEGCFDLYPTDYGFDTYREPEHVYHALLKPMLEEKLGIPVTILNAGISGDNSHHALSRIQSDVLDPHPDAAVVCFGLNDVFYDPSVYARSMDEIFSRLESARIPAIFLTPNMMNTVVSPLTLPSAVKIAEKTAAAQNDGTMDRLIEAGKTAARTHGAEICDFYAVWKAKAAAGEDTTALLANHINHPNYKMHRVAAEMLLSPLARLLQSAHNEDPL